MEVRLKYLFLILIAFLFGCENQFDPTLDCQPQLVVHSFINCRQPTQFVSISSTFCENQDNDYHTMNVNTDEIEVWMEFWDSEEIIIKPILFELVPVDETSTLNQINGGIYQTNFELQSGLTANLFIRNGTTRTCISSTCQTVSIEDLQISVTHAFSHLEFLSVENVYFYSLSVNFHFVEITKDDTVFRSLPYKGNTITNPILKSGINLELPLQFPDLFSFLASNLNKSETIKRFVRAQPIEMVLTIGDKALFDYQIQFGDNDFLFSIGRFNGNLNGGVGVFCSYDSKSLFKLTMYEERLHDLIHDDATRDLNFQLIPWTN